MKEAKQKHTRKPTKPYFCFNGQDKFQCGLARLDTLTLKVIQKKMTEKTEQETDDSKSRRNAKNKSGAGEETAESRAPQSEVQRLDRGKEMNQGVRAAAAIVIVISGTIRSHSSRRTRKLTFEKFFARAK